MGVPLALGLTSTAAAQRLGSELVADGLDTPTAIAHIAGDAERLFVCEREGRIRVVDVVGGAALPEPFLDLPQFTSLGTSGEQGLLGMAFHPDYALNRHFYVCYVDGGDDQVIERFTTSSINPNAAVPASQHRVLSIPREFALHCGGWIGFGPADGLLYVSSGDDRQSPLAQSVEGNLLGKLLRVNVNGDDFPADPERNYAIPPGNPFVGLPGEDEIIAFGLRNPWRAGFDYQTGDLLIGDVGAFDREEISVYPSGTLSSLNYGWPCYEGTLARSPGSCAPGAVFVDPVHDYPHGAGIAAVIGGLVYRGGAIPGMEGTYIFADYRAVIWSFRYDSMTGEISEFTDRTDELTSAAGFRRITTFGEDASGELYLATLDGALHRIVPGVACYADCDTTSDPGVLDVLDFHCFMDAFTAADPYADCTGDEVLDIFDFLCFQDAFAAGCP